MFSLFLTFTHTHGHTRAHHKHKTTDRRPDAAAAAAADARPFLILFVFSAAAGRILSLPPHRLQLPPFFIAFSLSLSLVCSHPDSMLHACSLVFRRRRRLRLRRSGACAVSTN